MIDKENWEKRVSLCKDAELRIKNKWLTASGTKAFLRHLPEYKNIINECPKKYEIVLNTIIKLYEYAKKMFNLTYDDLNEITNKKDTSYKLAMSINNQSFIGSICGDIIGSAYEFHKTKDINFKLFTPRSKFTDDTVMTCAVAEWLMVDPKHSHEQLIEIIHKYGKKYPNVSYGTNFRIWLETNKTKPYNSFGNGSAMRVSPCGYYAQSLSEALQLAKISAEVTHNHPEGIKGAQAVAAAVYMMKTASIKNSINIKEIKNFLVKEYSYKMEYSEIEWKNHTEKYTFNETCQGSVPEAIYCALTSNNYEQTVRKAVSLGGDADTQAAIAGGIASAYYPVPLNILSECLKLLPDYLINIIDSFNSTVISREMKNIY